MEMNPHHSTAASHDHGIAPYAWVFIALLALLAAAVVVAFIPTENYAVRAALTTLAYGIAFVKALLIVLWFMHLKESTRLTWLFAGAAFFFVAILILLTLNDYASRGMIRRPVGQPPANYVTPTVNPVR
jgi:cytochrome c oxidase subunit 4